MVNANWSLLKKYRISNMNAGPPSWLSHFQKTRRTLKCLWKKWQCEEEPGVTKCWLWSTSTSLAKWSHIRFVLTASLLGGSLFRNSTWNQVDDHKYRDSCVNIKTHSEWSTLMQTEKVTEENFYDISNFQITFPSEYDKIQISVNQWGSDSVN